jgi:hypothetical protein
MDQRQEFNTSMGYEPRTTGINESVWRGEWPTDEDGNYKNYYKVLGVDKNASHHDLDKAYK